MIMLKNDLQILLLATFTAKITATGTATGTAKTTAKTTAISKNDNWNG